MDVSYIPTAIVFGNLAAVIDWYIEFFNSRRWQVALKPHIADVLYINSLTRPLVDAV